jgi:hypothetical protein
MGIISFSHVPMLSVLLAPVQALVSLFLPAQGMAGASRFSAPAGTQVTSRQLALPFASNDYAAPRSPSTHAAGAPVAQCPARVKAPRSRLRVVREFDSNVSPACAGRMVISGRMADVCAELERMSQREASLR